MPSPGLRAPPRTQGAPSGRICRARLPARLPENTGFVPRVNVDEHMGSKCCSNPSFYLLKCWPGRSDLNGRGTVRWPPGDQAPSMVTIWRVKVVYSWRHWH
jgi:hypothetical protein